jgi:hypothetical protein
MVVHLITRLCEFLDCHRDHLAIEMHTFENTRKINELLKGVTLRTTYLDRYGEFKEFLFGNIFDEPANLLFAYGGYLKTTVQQHFYARHNIRLLYPNQSCVIERKDCKCGNGVERYYPLELLLILEDDEKTPKPITITRKRRRILGVADVDNESNDTESIIGSSYNSD